MNSKKHKVLYLHGRPMAHPMHTALAKAVGSFFYPVDKYLRWQDTNKSIVYRLISWLVNAFMYPSRYYDFILVDNLHFSPIIAKKLGLLKNRKLIVHLGSHTLYFMYANRFSNWVNRLHKYALKNYDYLLCEGKMAAELADKILDKKMPNAIVTYLGVPSERFARLKKVKPNLESYNIIVIANGPTEFREWYKGLDITIKSYCKAFNIIPNMTLTILGNWNREIIDHNLADLREDVLDSIRFIGNVSNIEDYLANSSLCLHLSRGDAFPTSTLEVMAAGVVPIVSEWTGTKEVVENVSKDLIAPLTEKTIVSKVIWYFLLSVKEKKQLSVLCKRSIDQYTEERAVLHYQEVFQKLGLNH